MCAVSIFFGRDAKDGKEVGVGLSLFELCSHTHFFTIFQDRGSSKKSAQLTHRKFEVRLEACMQHRQHFQTQKSVSF